MDGGQVASQPAAQSAQGQQQPVVVTPQPPLAPTQSGDQVKKIVGIKKAMTKTMTASLAVPTFTFSDDADCTALIALRQQLKTQIEGGITLLPFFMKALSLAMNDYPIINTVVSPDIDAEGLITQYVIKESHNFSVAIDSKDGLTTPNIKGVNNKSIKQLNIELKDLVYKVNENKLIRDDFDNGTFSVSSVGNIGGKYFVPTILRPQAAIIAIGKSDKKPKYGGQENGIHIWEPTDSISYSITADHRILDGATVARFSTQFKAYLEDPNLMLISS